MDAKTYQSPALKRVAQGALCAGCGGCALVSDGAVEMQMLPPGFLRPVQHGPVSAEAEAKIAALCPGLGQEVQAQDRPDHALWGPYLEMHTGHATDPDLRFKASSGGGLSALLVHLLEAGEIDGVVQTAAGALPDVAPVANLAVLSTSRAEILAAAGSRYAPSSPLAGLGPYLAADTGRYAFVGKPCDAAALRALERQDPRVSERFPYVLSFFCAGVPSQSAAEALLGALGTTPEEVTAFRYRGHGWPGRATATLADGTERSMTYMESWGQVLSRGVQNRCKICADGTGTAADIVCADAWEADANGYPLFEETDGTSLIVPRTAKGLALMQAARAAGQLETQPFDVAKLAAIQPGQTRRRQALLARLLGLRLTGHPVPRYRGLLLRAAARQNDLKTNAVNFAGMVRRALQRRL